MRRLAVFLALALGLALTLVPGALGVGGPDTPHATFTTSPASPVAGQTVSFNGSASADSDGDAITSYRWSFGDGDTQTTSTSTTTHIYAKAGQYSPTLVVVDSRGNASAPATGSVRVSTVEMGPVARFKVTPGHPVVGQTAVFDGSRSHDKDGDLITSYRWDFGDGTSQTSSSATVSHTYSAKGTFIATLTVLDSRANASPPASHTIKVHSVSVYRVPGYPTADFRFSPSRPNVGQSVRFDGSRSRGKGSRIKAYLWTFGDGSSSSSNSPLSYHAYAHPGRYTVQLVVENDANRFSSPATKKLTVGHPPRLTRLHVRVCRHKSRRCDIRGLRIRFRLSVTDMVSLRVTRRGHRRTLLEEVVSGRHGLNLVVIAFRGKRHAHYVLHATPAGGHARRARFVWRRR